MQENIRNLSYDEETNLCFICMQSGDLVSNICSCRTFVHKVCIEKFINASGKLRCTVCNEPYKYSKINTSINKRIRPQFLVFSFLFTISVSLLCITVWLTITHHHIRFILYFSLIFWALNILYCVFLVKLYEIGYFKMFDVSTTFLVNIDVS